MLNVTEINRELDTTDEETRKLRNRLKEIELIHYDILVNFPGRHNNSTLYSPNKIAANHIRQ